MSMDITIRQAIELWENFDRALRGVASHGNVAELYGYLFGGGPRIDDNEERRAADALVELGQLFERKRDALITIGGEDLHDWRNNAPHEVRHRVHVKVEPVQPPRYAPASPPQPVPSPAPTPAPTPAPAFARTFERVREYLDAADNADAARWPIEPGTAMPATVTVGTGTVRMLYGTARTLDRKCQGEAVVHDSRSYAQGMIYALTCLGLWDVGAGT